MTSSRLLNLLIIDIYCIVKNKHYELDIFIYLSKFLNINTKVNYFRVYIDINGRRWMEIDKELTHLNIRNMYKEVFILGNRWPTGRRLI